MPKLRYIGPIDEVSVDGVGDVKRDTPVAVPAEIAGRDPDPRLAVAMLELHEAIGAQEHERAAALRDEIVTLDVGEGLLAQGTWELVKTSKVEDPA